MTTLLVVLGGYALVILLGVPLAVWQGSMMWKSEKIQQKLKERSYESVKSRDVHGAQLFMLFCWPAALPIMGVVRLIDLVSQLGDPHAKHQQELDTQQDRWQSLVQLQKNLGEEPDTDMPMAWCLCQKDEVQTSREQHWMDRQIQHRVELLLGAAYKSYGEQWASEYRAKHLANAIKDHGVEIRNWMKRRGTWQ